MKGYGYWLQLSVFQCRLTSRLHAQMCTRLEELIHPTEDHILILDLGSADQVNPNVESLGKNYKMPVREAIIV